MIVFALLLCLATIAPLTWFFHAASKGYIEVHNGELQWVKITHKERAELEMELDAWKDAQFLKKRNRNLS